MEGLMLWLMLWRTCNAAQLILKMGAGSRLGGAEWQDVCKHCDEICANGVELKHVRSTPYQSCKAAIPLCMVGFRVYGLGFENTTP
jgi:hypothetical protein